MTQRKMSLSPSAFVEMDNSQVFVRPSMTSPMTSSTNMHVNQGLITNPRAGRAEKATSTLTLSYEELKHIRSALSRHKLESLCDPDLKAEIEKGSVCFHC